ncbi:hypothetical protein [Streptomyces erythrochromogenes]|uniref:hypothetical protein n=1 Tax=Streptomyces erythrochromogenes TaxID=285574 RepID=UPI00225600DD|nr:hypothetical protein [Streptomyces erythrochromogenes]MCX5587568.1 hypothetical protein [Streptomyces erythrochromogenes]
MTAQQQADEHLRRSRQDLPVAAQLLHVVADLLSDYQPEQPATTTALGMAFTAAGSEILAKYPRAVQDHALDRALAALPNEANLPIGITGGELALHLRKAAGSLT